MSGPCKEPAGRLTIADPRRRPTAMSRCITLASILTFAACTRSPSAPSEPAWAAPAKTAPSPTVAPVAAEPAPIAPMHTEHETIAQPAPAPVAATPTPAVTATPTPEVEAIPVDAACRMTRAGTCWGQPKKQRVTRTAPGVKP